MATISTNDHAAVASVSAKLAVLVTNADIRDLADHLCVTLEGSNKADKLRSLLTTLRCDGRRRDQVGMVIATLLMEGHARNEQGKQELFQEDVDGILAAAKRLGVAPSGLRGGWYSTLKRRNPAPTPAPATAVPKAAYTPAPTGPRAKRHAEAIDHLTELSRPGTDVHHRGHQLELIVFGILKEEGLSPERNIYNPGEEIDLSFILENQHYLAECKWTKDACGYPVLRNFYGKVETKADGTFGVLLSMSAFVDDINAKATHGRRLTSIGLGPMHLMNILEGRTTWAETVRRARMHASRRSIFYTIEP